MKVRQVVNEGRLLVVVEEDSLARGELQRRSMVVAVQSVSILC